MYQLGFEIKGALYLLLQGMKFFAAKIFEKFEMLNRFYAFEVYQIISYFRRVLPKK